MFIYQKYQMGDESLRGIKGTGNMFISLLESMHVGDLRFLQDTDDHEYGQNFVALLIFLLRIFYFLIPICYEI